MTAGHTRRVAGIDGCRGGWIVVHYPIQQPESADIHVVSSFAEALVATATCQAVGIDIPIGLPDRVQKGGRRCDALARNGLGGRASSVFSIPSRRAVYADSYLDACAAALATSEPPRKVSKQAYNLFTKIREVDQLMTPDLQRRVFECHPERVFRRLNHNQPLLSAKKIKSRANPAGLAERLALLQDCGFIADSLTRQNFPAAVAGVDDMIDAAAVSVCAADILKGLAQRVPETPDRDGKSLRMEIWG